MRLILSWIAVRPLLEICASCLAANRASLGVSLHHLSMYSSQIRARNRQQCSLVVGRSTHAPLRWPLNGSLCGQCDV